MFCRAKTLGLVVLGLMVFLTESLSASPETTMWTALRGPTDCGYLPRYGTKGVAMDGNTPGVRENAASWTGADGSLYLFGGTGSGTNGQGCVLSDLWKYDRTTNQWTWLNGPSTVHGPGVYGARGEASIINCPGARESAVSWTGPDGNLYLFGGLGHTTNTNYNLYQLNDLWKYDVAANQWTWVSGSNVANSHGSYGTQGEAAPGNCPGGREGAFGWSGPGGVFYLFGGYGLSSQQFGFLSDLWKYDPTTNQWTWVKGEDGVNSYGSYSPDATASNYPCSRDHGASWLGSDGALYLFGGWTTSYGYKLSDLWRYDIGTGVWTLVNGSPVGDLTSIRGAQGQFGQYFTPGGRKNPSCWRGADGMIYLFGGLAPASWPVSAYSSVQLGGDLWQYSPTLNQWAWLGGEFEAKGTYKTQGVRGEGTWPTSRARAVVWPASDGMVYMFGGNTFYEATGGSVSSYRGNDLWQLDPAAVQWTWLKGGNVARFNLSWPFSDSTSVPGPRSNASSWLLPSGISLVFGGYDSTSDTWYNDVWASSPTGWTRYKPSTPNAVYGTLNVGESTSTLGQRAGCASWLGPDNSLYVFGGGYKADRFNDLWKYQPTANKWTWLGGASTPNQSGIHGAKGTPGTANIPGARWKSACWKTSAEAVYLFGGASTEGCFDDMWKYNPADGSWTWLNGSDTTNSLAVHGTLGYGDPLNTPGGRMLAQCWVANGVPYLYGGKDFQGRNLSDLWKYDVVANEWVWVSGSADGGQAAVYGTIGGADALNTPGRRSDAATWVSDGLYLCGGDVSDTATVARFASDVWKYDPSTHMWTWVKGPRETMQPGAYPVLGVADANARQGARAGATAWRAGIKAYVFGGNGIDCGGVKAMLADLWSLDLGTIADMGVSVLKPSPVVGIVGQDVNCTATATNYGPDEATGVILTAVVPETWYSFVSGAATQGTVSRHGSLIVGDLGTMAKDALSTMSFVVRPTAETSYAALFAVTADQLDYVPANNIVSTTMSARLARADLAISTISGPPTVAPGETAACTMLIKNLGPEDAPGVIFTAPLAESLYVSSIASQGDIAWASGKITSHMGTIASGGQTSVTIVSRPPVWLSITGTVLSSALDTNVANNHAYYVVQGIPASDLGIVATLAPATANRAENTTYSFTLRNDGPQDVDGVRFVSTFGSETSYVSSSCSQGSIALVNGVVRGSIGHMARGGTATASVVLRYPTTGPKSVYAGVSATQYDPAPANNSVTVKTTAVDLLATDLELTGPGVPYIPALVGAASEYNFTVLNKGPMPATNIIFTAPVSESTYAGATCSQGSVSWAAGQVRGELMGLTPGTTATVSVKIRPNTPGTFGITASVAGAQYDPIPGNNFVSTLANALPARADLEVREITVPDSVTVGNPVTYSVQISNKGPSRATDVLFTSPLPPGARYASSSSTRGPSELRDDTVRNQLGILEAGESVQVSVEIEPVALGTLTLSAIVAGAEEDPVIANNTVSVVRGVGQSVSDLMTTITAPGSAIVGDNVTYVATVMNDGPGVAANVQFSSRLPAGVSYVSASSGQGGTSLTTDTVSCAIERLDVGSSATMSITVQVRAVGTFVFGAQAVSDSEDPSYDNNAAMASTEVSSAPGPDLQGAWKDVRVRQIRGRRPMSRVMGSLQVSNIGDAPAGRSVIQVRVSDSPSGTDHDTVLGQYIATHLEAGQSVQFKLDKLVAPSILGTGKYLLAVIDSGNAISEGNELNNTAVFHMP